MVYVMASVSDKSNKFGTSQSPEDDMDTAVRLTSGAVVDWTFFLAVGFCYGKQHMQNQGKKGFQTSWPIIVVLIGLLVALLVFGCYSSSTRSTTSTTDPLGIALKQKVSDTH